jgi:hypothetical protein
VQGFKKCATNGFQSFQRMDGIDGCPFLNLLTPRSIPQNRAARKYFAATDKFHERGAYFTGQMFINS